MCEREAAYLTRRLGFPESNLLFKTLGRMSHGQLPEHQSREEGGRLDAIAFLTLPVTICPHFFVAI